MIHLKKEKRRTKALVRDYIGKTVFLRREVSIPILRVGVQRAIWQPQQWRSFVSIPILRVGVQHQWSAKQLSKMIDSIPILRVGVQHPSSLSMFLLN